MSELLFGLNAIELLVLGLLIGVVLGVGFTVIRVYSGDF